MANTIVVAQQMWQRRDTAAAWTAANPVLHAGEIGVEVGGAVVKFKIGDGIRAWNALPYEGGGAGWLRGAGVPAVGLGADGNFYLNDSTADVYAKSAGAWTKVGTLSGGGGSGGGVSEIVAGANVSVDSTDPAKPVVSASGVAGPIGPAGPEGPRGGGIITGLKSLLHFDGSHGAGVFTDATGISWTPHGSAEIRATHSKFGGSSLYLGGAAKLTTPFSRDFSSTGSFTVEAWVRRDAALRNTIANTAYAATYGWQIAVLGNGAVQFYIGAGSYVIALTAASLVPVGEWAHVAGVKDGSTLMVFVNGVMQATAPVTGTPADPGLSVFTVGADSSAAAGRDFIGYMDEFRVSSVAQYTANFTPQAVAFDYPVAPQMPKYTLATLPSAATNAYVPIFVIDLTGGGEPCVSDGTNWRRFSDRSIAA